MNQVNLIGNLTRDPELRYTTGQNQTAVCRFSIAINDGYGDKKEVNYIPIVVFGKVAENCDKFLKMGRKVGVSGKIKTGSYEKDGRKIYTTDVVANSVEFLSRNEERQEAPQQTPQQARYQEAPQQTMMNGFMAVQDDDIPF